jgi:PAS domain S-box-containing protein
MTPQTILLVEDNALTRKMVRFALEKRGYAVLEATDGKTALSLTESRHPDLILQDLVLPDVDGFDLVTRLRALPHGGKVSILAFSGLLSKFEEARIASVGFDDVIAKPIEPSRLIPIVEAHLLGPASAEPLGAGRRLVLADDDPIQLKLTRFRLERLGFVVDAASDGIEALEAALRTIPDGIVSDVLMPRLDGFGLALAVRKEPRLAKLPVLLVTSSYVDETDRDLARRSGANDLIVRSPDQRELVTALRTVLQEAPPQIRTPPAELQDLERERSGRVVHQLERQVTLNSGLARRCATLAAELSVLTGISDAVVKHGDVESALDEALGSCLDVGGITLGVLYFSNPGGMPKSRVLVGSRATDPGEITEFFGHARALDRAIAEGGTVFLPSTTEDAAWETEVLRRCKATFGALLPLPGWGTRPSALFMAVQSPEYDQEDWRLFAQGVGNQIAQALALANAFAEKETAERISQEQTQLLTLILDGVGEGVIAADSAGNVVRMNRVASELTEWPANVAEGQKLERIFPIVIEESREPVRDAFLRALDAENTGGFTRAHLLVSRSGRERPVEVRGAPIRGEGRGTRGAVVVFRDISEAREAERALRESEQRFRSTFEQAAVGVAHVAPDGRLLDVNQRLCDILGYTRSALRSKTFREVTQVDEHDPDVELTRKVLNAELPKFSLEKRIVRHSGEPVWIELTVSLVRDDFDAPKYLVAVVQDIASRKHAEEELRVTTEQLRQSQKMEAIGQLAGGVAHDFNNLLSVVLGYGRMLLGDLGPSDAIRSDIQQIVEASERAANLTRQLLAFSRKQVLSPRLVDLNAVLDEMSQLLHRLIGEDIELTFKRGATGKTLVDPGQVEQVLMNLVVNARDAMPQGGKLTIETEDVTLDPDYAREHLDTDAGQYVLLSVSDTGIGMDAFTRSRIFEPFFTTKEKGKGTGLGLSTVFGIVKQSGGSIWVYSEPKRGTTFKVYLPRSDEPGRARSQVPGATKSLRGEETVLLVEDDPQVRALAQTILQRNGYHVLAAMSGAEALAICKQFSGMIHVLLTDVVMPGLGGRQLAEQLAPLRPRMRVIFMSGYTDDAIVHHGVLSSGLAFIQKPLLPEPMLRKLREVLDRVSVRADER